MCKTPVLKVMYGWMDNKRAFFFLLLSKIMYLSLPVGLAF